MKYRVSVDCKLCLTVEGESIEEAKTNAEALLSAKLLAGESLQNGIDMQLLGEHDARLYWDEAELEDPLPEGDQLADANIDEPLGNVVTVQITDDDIRTGVKGDPCACPLALAFARTFPGSDPFCNADGAVVMLGGERVDLYLPDDVVEWMDAFDRGDSMKPLTVVLLK